MDIATVFEWFAEESKSIAEQETEPAQREKFAKLASLWANATAESTSATSLPRPDFSGVHRCVGGFRLPTQRAGLECALRLAASKSRQSCREIYEDTVWTPCDAIPV